MAIVRQKEQIGRRTRVVESACVAGTRCDVKAGNHIIVTDEAKGRGGNDEGAPPLFHLAAALASCQTVQIIKVAEAMRFKHGAVNIRATATTDLIDGIEGNRDGVMHFNEAELFIEIETNEPSQKIERLKALSEDRCPVSRLFVEAGYPPKMSWTVSPLAE
ncbi:MAG: putative OsmC-like protein [Alphaproteobacteria bacterium]|jgi:putative redox protein